MDILGDGIYNEVYIPKHLPTFLHQYVQSIISNMFSYQPSGFLRNVTFWAWKSCRASTHQRTHIPTTFTPPWPQLLKVSELPWKGGGLNAPLSWRKFRGSGRWKKLSPFAPDRFTLFTELLMENCGRIFPRDVSCRCMCFVCYFDDFFGMEKHTFLS